MIYCLVAGAAFTDAGSVTASHHVVFAATTRTCRRLRPNNLHAPIGVLTCSPHKTRTKCDTLISVDIRFTGKCSMRIGVNLHFFPANDSKLSVAFDNSRVLHISQFSYPNTTKRALTSLVGILLSSSCLMISDFFCNNGAEGHCQ